ncbi:MAG: DMT family transporter [Candidatus Eremiobacteraeota bacterium]|nr:DMT family transporter [Candidatus Eremiobacteraeota bacterium]MBV8333801.1 DMT family transporter [Candidatus Eremiobacteraeota bacterium]MBV8435699.1 DMT family transporter [Candidatus Eremiobacteraeota bacterium]
MLVYLGLLYVIVCWGLNVVLVKSAIVHLDPLAFTALRFLAMTPLAFALVRATGEKIRFRREDAVLLAICAACGYGIYQYLWILGLANTSAFASSLLGATAPVFTLAIVALVGRERIGGMRWIGAGLALFGIAIFEGAFAGHATFRIGDLLTLLSSISFACYNVATARLLDRYSPTALVAITMTMGMLMILPAGIPRLLHADLAHLGWGVWGPFLFAVVFPIVLTWPVWNYGISKIGAARAGLFGFLVPIVAGVASTFVLRASFEPHQLVGAAVCLAGMALATILGRVSLSQIWAERSLPLER